MRFMKVDSTVDGKEIVLDRKTHVLLPCADFAQGLSRTHFDVLEPYDRPQGSLPPFRNPLDIEENLQLAKEEVKRARELIKGLKAPPAAELTVGDLSFVTAEKRKKRSMDAVREARNVKEGLTVGDLSVCGSRNSRRSLADEMRKFDDWKKRLTVGDLSWVTARKYADKYEQT